MTHFPDQRGGIFGKLLGFLFLLALIAAGILGYGVYEVNKRLNAAGPLEETSLLWIERGNSLDRVGSKLKDMGALEDPRLFKIAARIDDLAPSLQAGEFEIPANASVNEIVRLLKESKPLLRFVTIPEGLTTRQIIARLKEAPMLVGEVTIELKEGDLLPETYSYQRGDNRDSIIERMKEAHDDVLAVLWETRAEGLPLDTPEEAVILASIVEKETGIAAERPRVAGVFINRLNKGMRLQSDPTIIYGLTGGEPLGRGIRLSELRKETPYNTYVIRGLPPTPIANPGRDALAAVLNPLETNDLYFVADGTGGHVFATNLAQHNRNVAKWRRIERERQSQE